MGTIFGELRWIDIKTSFRQAIGTTCSLFVIVICAVVFSYFVTQAELPQWFVRELNSLQLGPVGLVAVLSVFYIVLGCFMDGLGMILITVPVFLPLVVASGFDPIWFGVMLVIVIELGLIHPPVGMNIFIIQAQAPEIPVLKIYKGILPFLVAPLLMLVLLVAFPEIALWLPRRLFP